ncbi:MAG TPA: T9SS type A sorting domain-containing protein, partial [Chitinophagales bacterium]|nr:T9SS type A sorting domain-containing protein [Chitinophagales bacterium]
PSDGNITITFPAEFHGAARLKIYNSAGIVVHQSVHAAGSLQMHLSRWNAGAYWVSLQTKEKNYFGRFIVAK